MEYVFTETQAVLSECEHNRSLHFEFQRRKDAYIFLSCFLTLAFPEHSTYCMLLSFGASISPSFLEAVYLTTVNV